jgi:hypothetical protein
MVQKATSETSSWTVETDHHDIAGEVERACTRLQDAVREQKLARESMELLFKKRRDDALNEVKKAQHHLQFVNEEEERLREILSDGSLNTSKVSQVMVQPLFTEVGRRPTGTPATRPNLITNSMSNHRKIILLTRQIRLRKVGCFFLGLGNPP